MADQKLSQLTASAALTGAELVYVVQGGNQRRTTTEAISATAPGTDLTFTAATRTLASSTGADVVLPVATTTDAGLESAADKTKLDSITVDTATLVRKLVRNNSGVSIPKGAAVYQTGSSGTTLTVALADASEEATASQTLGLAQEAIANNANGYIVAVGLLDGISTAALTEGQIVWLSETAGALTTTKPTPPAHGVVCGYCVKQGSGTSGILYVKVDNGLELDELHDVLITSPTAGQVLRRASDGLWKNAVLAAADISGLGTAAPLNHGTAAGNLVRLDGSGLLPAVDGSQLTNLPGGGISDGDKGDITVSASGATWTIDNGCVGTPKLGGDITTAGKALLDDADAAAQRTTLGLGGAAVLSVGASAGTVAAGDDSRITGALAAATAATTYQPLDSDLTAIAGLTTATFGRSLLTQADAAAARATLGVSNSVYAVGNWINPFDGTAVGGSALTANTIALYSFIFRRTATVDNLGARVTTVAAGSNVQLAIYDSDSNNKVTGLPLGATGNLSGATATTVNASVTAFTIAAGQIYWMAINSNGTPTMLAPSAFATHMSNILGGPALADALGTATNSLVLRTVAQTFGTWPDLTAVTPTVVSASANAQKGALIAMQVSALP
jgi:hypothetical protein